MRQYYNRGWTYRSIILTIVILLFSYARVVAQTQKITGTVRDVQGAPLPGVSVVVAGTSTGTITDVEGKFSISAAKGNTLTFSFVGYQPGSEKIANADVLNIQLVPDETNLSEVVVVGYGTQTKRELTGAITSIKAAEMKDIPATNISQRLQGKLAGVQINQNTGQPGAELSIRIRGAASINAGNNPLIVVDGFPTTSGLNVINPDAIESITVLKDAAAASLYGSRAANGVILVTTKQAKNGQRNVQFSSFVGVQSVSDRGKPDLMNAPEFAQFKKEYYEDAALYEGYKGGVPQQYQNPSQYGPNDGTNWFNVLLRPAAIQDYNLSISTDAKTIQSAVHLGYNKQDGVMLNNSASRFTVRANNIFSVSPKLRLGLNLAATHYVTNITPGLGEGRNIIQVAYLSDPTLKYRNDDGTYPIGFAPPGMFSTPNYYNVLMQTVNPAKYMVLTGNAYVDYQVLKGLNFKSSININTSNDINRLFQPSTIRGGPTPAASASGSYNTANYVSWLSENTLTYNRSFGNHNLEALLGYTTQKVTMENSTINGSQFPDNSIQWLNVAANRIGNVGASDYSLISYLGRLNYNYKGNYLLSLAFRSDGSSRFGSNKRFGTFPSASFGWVVSDEKFMNRYKFIDFLKVRASYGQVGNNNIGNYTYLAGVNPSNYVFNNALASGRVLAGIGNSNLTWETTTGFDLGLDLSILNNRVNFTYDYYYKKTDGLLYAIDIPVQSGYSAVSSNIGRFDFWGHEFAIDTRNIEGKFNWSTSFNISFNRNLVRKLGTNDAPIGGYQEYWDDNRTAVGHPIGLFYGYVNTGVYMTQQEFDSQPHGATSMIGTARFADINGDVKIDINDRTFIGDPNPDFVYGMTNTLSYKKLDLSIVVAGTVGNDIADDAFQSTENIDGVFNVRKGVARRWRSPENPGDGIYPRTRAGTTADFRNFSTRQVFSGTYLAVKNITLGYLIPIGNNKTIKSFRAYFSTQNPVLFTKYPGMNPEVGLAGLNGLNQGRDFTAFPIARVYTLGVNVNF
ncbi:TonB-dependent receptor [Spirosoma flavus]